MGYVLQFGEIAHKREHYCYFCLLFAGIGPISQIIFDRLEFKQCAGYAVS